MTFHPGDKVIFVRPALNGGPLECEVVSRAKDGFDAWYVSADHLTYLASERDLRPLPDGLPRTDGL